MGRESKCIPEEAGSFPCKSCSLACDGYVLAGESSANKVGSSHKSDGVSELNCCPYVVMLGNIGPMLVQHGAAMLVNLNLGDALMACTFQAEIKPADTSEQGHEPHVRGARSSGIAAPSAERHTHRTPYTAGLSSC